MGESLFCENVYVIMHLKGIGVSICAHKSSK
jgi:hypothetical protein